MKNLFIITFILLTFQCSSSFNHENNLYLEKGLTANYLSISKQYYNVSEDFNLFYITIDPKHYYLDLLIARDFNKEYLKAKEFLKLSNSILTINGSFFDKDYHPLGLQIQKGKLIQDIKNIDGGVFFVKQGKAEIVHTSEFKHHKEISFAFQSRPRLVKDGKAFSNLKMQSAERSFIGITHDEKIIIGVTEDSKAYTRDLAYILALPKSKKGLNCKYALNLDGGSSSQLYIKYQDYEKSIPGTYSVPNALALFKSQNNASKPAK